MLCSNLHYTNIYYICSETNDDNNNNCPTDFLYSFIALGKKYNENN